MQRSSGIAVTGVGCICALGSNAEECRSAMFQRGVPLPGPKPFRETSVVACPVFEVTANLLTSRVFRRFGVSRTSGLALTAAYEAVNDSLLLYRQGAPLTVGVCIGTTVGSALNDTGFYAAYLDRARPDTGPVSRFLDNNPASVIATEFGFSGPCQTIVNACSSGTDAIGIGASWITSGLCDVVVAGGADELSIVTYNGFVSLMVTDNSPCKPFDRSRRGLNLGEGAAIVVLESGHARLNGEGRTRGFVRGYGSGCDAYHLTAPSPDGSGLRSSIAEALRASGTTGSDIAFVNAHGTGTLENDKVESRVLHDLLPSVPYLSTKAYTGHTLGAAGAIEAVLTLICLREGAIPASPGFLDPDPDLPASPVSEPRALGGRVALSESLAFGGHNSALVLEACDE